MKIHLKHLFPLLLSFKILPQNCIVHLLKARFFFFTPQVSSVSDSPVEEVGGHSVAVCQHSLVMKRPSAHVAVAGTLSYQSPLREPQTVQFSYRLSLINFIRCVCSPLCIFFCFVLFFTPKVFMGRGREVVDLWGRLGEGWGKDWGRAKEGKNRNIVSNNVT